MLLCLHGFLGQKEDWDPLLSHMSLPAVAIDLPGHGTAPMTDDIALAVHEKVPNAPFIVGYSAGGRIALELKERFPQNYGTLILFSTHLGFENEEERKRKLQQEQKWIKLLSQHDMETFLEKWYEQELFSSFRHSKHFSSTLKNRAKQDPEKLRAFLEVYGSAKKRAPEVPPNAILVYGEEDLKYERQYRKLYQIHRVYDVKNASHAIHLENPGACAKIIEEVIHANNLA